MILEDRKPVILSRIKSLIEQQDNSKDDILTIIMENMASAIVAYRGFASLPIDLEYICVETSIIRYNRLGAEGLKAESIDVIKSEYVGDVLSDYYTVLDKYNSGDTSTSKKVRFY